MDSVIDPGMLPKSAADYEAAGAQAQLQGGNDSQNRAEQVAIYSVNQVYGKGWEAAYNCYIKTTEGVNMNGNTRPGRINPIIYPVYRLRDSLVAFALTLEHWRRREQMSMQFAHIDAHTLRDAGISDAQRFIGVHHPFD